MFAQTKTQYEAEMDMAEEKRIVIEEMSEITQLMERYQISWNEAETLRKNTLKGLVNTSQSEYVIKFAKERLEIMYN